MNPTKAVVLAREPDRYDAGVTPALLSVANRPLMRHALEWLEDGGIREVAIVASDGIADHAREAMGRDSDWSLATTWVRQHPGESLGESLAALTGFIDDEPFVLHLADSLAKDRLPCVLGGVEVDDLGAVVLTHGSGRRTRAGGRHPQPPRRRNGTRSTPRRPPASRSWVQVCSPPRTLSTHGRAASSTLSPTI